MILADLLGRVATRAQVVVCTQSVTLVNQFQPEDLVIVEREQDQPVLRRPSADEASQWLDDYALVDLCEKNVLGGRPRA